MRWLPALSLLPLALLPACSSGPSAEELAEQEKAEMAAALGVAVARIDEVDLGLKTRSATTSPGMPRCRSAISGRCSWTRSSCALRLGSWCAPASCASRCMSPSKGAPPSTPSIARVGSMPWACPARLSSVAPTASGLASSPSSRGGGPPVPRSCPRRWRPFASPKPPKPTPPARSPRSTPTIG